MNKKINVLFIGGFGRSGSTLLDNVFGQIDEVFSIGELRFIWDRGLQEKQLCGCKKTLYECEIWSKIFKEAYGHIDDEFITYMIDLSQKVDKPKFLLKLILKYDKNYNKLRKAYQNELEKLYIAIHKVTGAKLIVDSSKTPSHGFIINQIESLDVKVLHLIRDLRAVTYSWKKKKIRPEITNTQVNMATYSSIRSSIWWSGSNIFTEILGRKSKQVFIRHYESFCEYPQKFIKDIINTYPELQQKELGFIKNKEIYFKQTHTVAGNPSRFKLGNIAIRIDDEWHKNIRKRDKILTTLLAWPLLLRYGYFSK